MRVTEAVMSCWSECGGVGERCDGSDGGAVG